LAVLPIQGKGHLSTYRPWSECLRGRDAKMGGHATPGQGIKNTDAASYDAVATTFDQLSERFSAPIAERLLDIAKLAPAERVLDLGTGAGLLALRAAAQAPAGKVIGIDHSSGMLRQAEEKAGRLGLSDRVAFRRMDAESLEFDAGSFDVAVSLFVLLHLPNPRVAVNELHRVLRPGGRAIIGLGSGAPLLSAAGVAQAGRRLMELAQARGRVLAAPAFMQALMVEMGLGGQEGEHMPHYDRIDARKLLAGAGFTRIHSFWTGAMFALSPEEFWDVCATYGSAERVRLGALSPEATRALKEEFLRRTRSVVARNGRLEYRCGARIYAASRDGRS
jgi:SAM-dependent methyltransferase